MKWSKEVDRMQKIADERQKKIDDAVHSFEYQLGIAAVNGHQYALISILQQQVKELSEVIDNLKRKR